MTLADWIGFIGVFQILLAYIGNVAGVFSKNSLSFIILNIIGATMACIASVMISYMPFVVLEGIWAIVSLVALYNHLKQKL